MLKSNEGKENYKYSFKHLFDKIFMTSKEMDW